MRLSLAQITAAVQRTRRRDAAARAAATRGALRERHLTQPAAVTTAYAETVRSAARVIGTLNEEIRELETQVNAHFGTHPDAEIYLSRPGVGQVTGGPATHQSRMTFRS